MTPHRIQRKRSRGWKMPDGAIYVGRPTKWGNPFRVGETVAGVFVRTNDDAVSFFEDVVGGDWDDCRGTFPEPDYPTIEQIRTDLRGRDLACWCPLDQSCHADVLLRLANQADGAPT